MVIELFSVLAILGALFIIVEKIGKIPFLILSISGAIIGIFSYYFYGTNSFANGIFFISFVSFFLGGGKIPKL